MLLRRCTHLYVIRDDERGRGRGPAVPKWGPGPRLSGVCFGLRRQHHYLSTVQVNPFRPDQSHSATDIRSFRFIVKIFSRSPASRRGGGRRKKVCFPPEPVTTLGDPVCTHIALSEFFFKRYLPVRPTFHFAGKQKQGLITNNTNSVLDMSVRLKRS
jgi:hypothetical protein